MANNPLHTLTHKLRATGNGVPLPILLILGVLALAAILIPALIVTTAPRVVVHKTPHVVISKRIVPKTELPPVEPVTFQQVEATDAKAINGQIPFSTLPNPAARPFHLFGAADSQARAVDCLAAAEIYEAGGGDSIGERAVAQVVINRMKHPAFPKTICGVVFQGSERTTGCQFSFTCDGAMLRWPVGGDSWQRARDIARQALNGAVYAPVGHATHYHTDWVVPYWSASLEKITAVHTHLFFRWAGWWGTPPAFTRGYAGAEPNIPLMSRVSAAHHGDPNAPLLLDPLATSNDPLASVDPASIPASAVPAATPADTNIFILTLPKGISPDAFASLAIRTCGERTYCKFMAWADGRKTAPRLPLTSEQVANMSFSYLRDENQSFAKALWNCDQYRRPSPVQCMRAQPLARPPVEAAPMVDGKPVGPAGLPGVRRKEPAPAPASSKPPAVTFTLPAPKPIPTTTPARN